MKIRKPFISLFAILMVFCVCFSSMSVSASATNEGEQEILDLVYTLVSDSNGAKEYIIETNNSGLSMLSSGDGSSSDDDYEYSTERMYPIGEEGVARALQNSFKGSIWITYDGTTFGIDHGHAAMLYTNSPWDKRTLEHRGGSANPIEWLSLYSTEYDLETDTYWENVKTIKTYYVKDDNGELSPSNMITAADYCYEHLLNRPYNALPSKIDYSVNCASLIYQAYKDGYDPEWNSSIILGVDYSDTVIPKHLVEDEHLSLGMSLNWPGEHTWELTWDLGYIPPQ